MNAQIDSKFNLPIAVEISNNDVVSKTGTELTSVEDMFRFDVKLSVDETEHQHLTDVFRARRAADVPLLSDDGGNLGRHTCTGEQNKEYRLINVLRYRFIAIPA
jgi:hypothetical protein